MSLARLVSRNCSVVQLASFPMNGRSFNTLVIFAFPFSLGGFGDKFWAILWREAEGLQNCYNFLANELSDLVAGILNNCFDHVPQVTYSTVVMISFVQYASIL